MKKRLGILSIVTIFVIALFALATFATTAELFFSVDKNGASRVNLVQEGTRVWIGVVDPDENVDCDDRDKIWVAITLEDLKTGAWLDWLSSIEGAGADTDYVGRAGDKNWGYFLEETGNNTGVFVSNESFEIGSRVNYTALGYGTPGNNTHTAGSLNGGDSAHIENMDTLVGTYTDQNDLTDVSVAMLKIIDVEAEVVWDETFYPDANGGACVTIYDMDENLNCNVPEWVPVFFFVNPGSWNPMDAQSKSATNFCLLKRWGGVLDTALPAVVLDAPITWQTIYNSGTAALDLGTANLQESDPGTYYVQYPTTAPAIAPFNPSGTNGVTRVMFYAQETGPSTGIFEFCFNNIRDDLGFVDLRERDVLVAYYLDPNDEDDFTLSVAYIGAQSENNPSLTTFTDANHNPMYEYWLGRDPVYVEVIDENANEDSCCPEALVVHICDPHESDDAEWIILNEEGSNSWIFFTNTGYILRSAFDANGVDGYQLVLDNWKLEGFNEDTFYARYNDQTYFLGGLGDSLTTTAFPPTIDTVRVANDVSFDLMKIGDTQVFDGSVLNMQFLDRLGNPVGDYEASDCVFIEVTDPDQNEDIYRRERIDSDWDKDKTDELRVWNARTGTTVKVDLMETAPNSGVFVSVICIELKDSLNALPGDVIIAAYQDPSNPSDAAWKTIKVGYGGGGTPVSLQSTAKFADVAGAARTTYTDAEMVYVLVVDPSRAGAALLADAVEINGITEDAVPFGTDDDTFIATFDLGLVVGDTITATYTDPNDPTDIVVTDPATITASVLEGSSFYVGPSPFDVQVTFGFGEGVASEMKVCIYNLAGKLVWEKTDYDVSEISWEGDGLANGCYIYVVTATDGTNPFSESGKVFINR